MFQESPVQQVTVYKSVSITDSNVYPITLARMNMKHQRLSYMYDRLLLIWLSFDVVSGKIQFSII